MTMVAITYGTAGPGIPSRKNPALSGRKIRVATVTDDQRNASELPARLASAFQAAWMSAAESTSASAAPDISRRRGGLPPGGEAPARRQITDACQQLTHVDGGEAAAVDDPTAVDPGIGDRARRHRVDDRFQEIGPGMQG